MTSDTTSTTETASLKAELEARLRFETLLADLSAKLINLPAGEIDRQIEDAQRLVCDALGLDVSSLWQWKSDNPWMLTLTHYYRPLGGPPIPQTMDAQEFFPWCQRQVLARKVVIVSSLADLPVEAARDREVWGYYGVKTRLTFPLSAGGGPVFGCVSFNDMKAERRWSEALVQQLQLVAQIFANALARKVTDQALRDSEARLSLAADAAGAGLWILHLKTHRFWLTQKNRELFDLPPDEEVTFERFLSLVHVDDRKLIHQTVQTMVQTRDEGRVEYSSVRPDSTIRWLSSRGRIQLDAAGSPDQLMGVTVDITQRKLAEQKLNQLFLALEQSPVLVVITDLQGKMTYVNRKFSEVTGYSAAESIGQNPRLLKSGECPASTYQELWTRITRGETWRGEFHNRKKNGELYWASAVISPLLDDTGQPTHFIGVTEDITERKRTEAALQMSQARLASAVDVAALGFYEMGDHPKAIFLDERLRSLLGLTVAEDHRAREFWAEHIHPDDRARMQELSRQVLDGGLDQAAVEYRYLHPQWGTRWFSHLSRVHARDPAGQAVQRLGVVRDITEQRWSELETGELRNELAHLLRVTTLSELAGSLAHELNQPLGIILSNAQAAQELLLQHPPVVSEVGEILTDIVAADRRAAEIIRRLRALMKRGEASLQPLPINELLEEVLRLVQADLIGRGVTPICHLAPNLPLISGDRVQLQQLALNLILNAADAMRPNPPGRRRLHLTTRLHQQAVRVSVRDEDSGLPANVVQIFQPFYTTKTSGLGMGLTICRSIITAHSGRLWAEPHPERGAIFHFELPVAGTPDPP